jgi:hypothetical protein
MSRRRYLGPSILTLKAFVGSIERAPCTGTVIPVVPPLKPKVTPTPAVEFTSSSPAVSPTAFRGSVPVYATRTGDPEPSWTDTHSDTHMLEHQMLEEVARSVFTVWATTATPAEVTALLAERPNVPSQIDRILLTDLVTRSGVYDIPSWARFDLRDFFWVAADKALNA